MADRDGVGEAVTAISTGSVSVVILIEEALTSVSLLRSQISPAATCIASSTSYAPHTTVESGYRATLASTRMAGPEPAVALPDEVAVAE
jgi:hypothetical protein